jgi:crotonobetainyl-CoA:carnitine CoA-transferase CaiB-like acyl-CoA transferase
MLDGLIVVELATVIAGPCTCALLADMGATVIKVEPPAGDSFRLMGVNPRTQQTSYGEAWGDGFEHCNRGKRSVVLDFRQATDQAAMLQLLAGADVFVTNVRKDGLKNLGLDFDSLHTAHPRLIYGHLTAWGLGGPDESYPGYDVGESKTSANIITPHLPHFLPAHAGAFWAASGLMDYVSPNDETATPAPRFPGGLGDQTTAVHLLAGVLGALYDREKTGEGQFVEACLYRAGMWTMGERLDSFFLMCSRVGWPAPHSPPPPPPSFFDRWLLSGL